MARTYVISGGASGIGRATADRLGAEGHRVITVDRHDADVVVDLLTAEGRAALADRVAAAADGRVDAAIACAGTVGQGASDILVNHFGAVAMLTGLRPLLAAGNAPRAVAVASFAVLEQVDDALVDACLGDDVDTALERVQAIEGDPMRIYASGKRALARWVRRSAPSAEWAGAGIALNAVGPGIVRTPMTQPLLDEPALAEALRATVPMPYEGILAPESIAHVLAFLTDPALRSITGQLLFADGGADCVVRGDDVWG